MDYLWNIVFLSAVWTLILTAPIHCRGSTGEGDVMLNLSKSVMTKKQTYFNFLEVHILFFVVNAYNFNIDVLNLRVSELL